METGSAARDWNGVQRRPGVPPVPGDARLAAYGALGLPLAFAALPIYVHVPKLYADELSLPLALVGTVLLVTRVVDAFSDPLLGWFSDRVARRRALICSALPVLALGMIGLLDPPSGAGALWLGALLVLVTAGYSLATINYHAWGAELAQDAAMRTRVVAWREGFGLLGVVLAASLPALLAAGGDAALGLMRSGWLFLPLLVAFALPTLLLGPPGPAPLAHRGPIFAAMFEALGDRDFRRLLGVFAANGIAAAIPASTVLFFIDDVLRAPELSGALLAVYFVAGALSLPLWVRLAGRFGKASAWAASMMLAMLVFGWAFAIGAGDVTAFAVICVLSGATLGADLALPPAMLADLLGRRQGTARAGALFGLWNLVTKSNLALAAGLALPLLALLDYRPGSTDPAALGALAATYGLLPLTLKLVALYLLLRWRKCFGEDR